LTDAGVLHWQDIIAIVIEYVRILRTADKDKLVQLYDEQTAINSADFQFQSRSSEETYVDDLSNALLRYPSHLVLFSRHCCIEPVFDYEAFGHLIHYFNCDNMRLHLTAALSQQPDSDQPWLSEQWYGTQYRMHSFVDSFEGFLGNQAVCNFQAFLEVHATVQLYHYTRS
jgi:secreted Zn-dependent insulinase-like peptidase